MKRRSPETPDTTGLVPRLATGGVGVAIVLAGHAIGLLVQRAIVYRKDPAKKEISLPVVSAGYVSYYVSVVIALSIALRLNGIDTSALLALLSAAGFTIGLALQGPLSNAAAGMFLTIGGGFSLGDTISINGTTGVVTRFTLFQTTLTDPRGNSIIVPNKMLSEGVVMNGRRISPGVSGVPYVA